MPPPSRPRGGRLLAVGAVVALLTGAALVTASPATATTASAAVTGGAFVPVAPQRVLDTRSGLGLGGVRAKLGPDSSLTTSIVGRDGMPAAGVASAVILNLTAANGTAGTFLTAYPGDEPRPSTSSLNVPAGVTLANTVVVPVDGDGTMAVYNALGSTDVVADVVGYYAAAESTSYGGVTPVVGGDRLYDSRDGDGPFTNGEGVDLSVDLGADNPNLTGFVLDVTAVSPTGPGYVTAWNGSGPKPGTSALNFRKGVTAANLVEVARGDVPDTDSGSGTLPGFRLQATTFGGAADLVVDLVGYTTTPGVDSDARFVPLATPTRIVDTRAAQAPNLAPATSRTFAEQLGDGATGLLMANLTVAGPTAPTYVALQPGAGAPSGTSNLNANANAVVANAAIVQLADPGSPGSFAAYNSAGTTPFLVDVSGYFDVPGAATSGGARRASLERATARPRVQATRR